MHQKKQTLVASTIPNLQPPLTSQFNHIPTPQNVIHTMNNTMNTTTFSSADSSPAPHNPWYREKQNSSDASDDEIAQGYLPLDLALAGASTPLQEFKGNSSFLSPLNKLDNLHLESRLDLEDEVEYEQEYAGNRTITNESDSEVEYTEDYLHNSPPQYINIRKRQHVDTSDISMNTPMDSPKVESSRLNSTPKVIRHVLASTPSNTIMTSLRRMERHIDDFDDMSICSSISTSKISFSQSDSTPCPVEPKRKKLKLKNDSTPSGRSTKYKSILNLSHSIKTTASSVRSHLNYYDDDDDDDEEEEIEIAMHGAMQNISAIDAAPELQSTPYAERSEDQYTQFTEPYQSNVQSTPISQSTPANSRSSTPPVSQEFGEPINGYKFLKPFESETQSFNISTDTPTYKSSTNIPIATDTPTYKPSNTATPNFRAPSIHTSGTPNYRTPKTQTFSYQTPLNPRVSDDLKSSYTRNDYTPNDGKYQIVGELPVTSAGLMDEREEDLHVGDKRIGDPYLTPKSDVASNDSLKDEYYNSSDFVKLPLLPPHFDNQTNLSKQEVVGLLTNSNLYEFYKLISDGETDLDGLIKSERVRWHPDRWVGREIWFDMDIVNLLSQSVNSLLDNIRA